MNPAADSNQPTHDWARLRRAYDELAPLYRQVWQGQQAAVEALLARLAAWTPAGSWVLDAGCGPGLSSAWLAAQGYRVVGLDLSWGMLQHASPLAAGGYVQADMRFPPFAPAFEGLVALASLLHLPRADTPAVLNRLIGRLKPEGVALLSVKEGRGESWEPISYQQPIPRFYTYWEAADWDELLTAAGLEIVERPADTFSGSTRWLNRLCRRRTPPASTSTM